MSPGAAGRQRPSVILLGDVMTDLVARLDGPLVPASDSPARISAEGGGAAANTASWLAGLGTSTVLLGRVGADPAGRTARRTLRAAGVQTCFAVDRQRPTGTVIVLVEPDGERTMVPDAGANAALCAQDLPAELFVRGAHLHLSGYTLLRAGSREAGLKALALAREARMTVSVDAASAGPLEAAGPTRFLAWIGGIDILFANLAEARVLGRAISQGSSTSEPGFDDTAADVHPSAPRALAALLTERCRLAVVKLGAQGALACSDTSECEQVDAVALGDDATVDSTGAGDAFAAGFLHAWLHGRSSAEALRSGSEVAARAVSGVGARAAGSG